MNELAPRDQIAKLKELCLAMPQVDIPIKNYFSTGVYAREMYVKAGTTITGKIHKDSTIDILLQGSIIVVDDSGIARTLKAPMIFESKPGVSKAGHVIEDVRWVTIHGVEDETKPVDDLVRDLVVESYQEYLDHVSQLRIEGT